MSLLVRFEVSSFAWKNHGLNARTLVLFFVGTVCCRAEQREGGTGLYLMTMGILAVRFSEFLIMHCTLLIPWNTGVSRTRSRLAVPASSYRSRGSIYQAADIVHLPPRPDLKRPCSRILRAPWL